MSNRQVTLPNGAVVTINDKGDIVGGNPTNGTVQAPPTPTVVPQAPVVQQPTQTQTTQTTTVVQPPNVQLTPGMSGAQVKQLQDYLVSKGLMTAQQVATGPGVYGPATTAAVAALQKSLGVDNSSGVGYYGPKTLAAVSSQVPKEQRTQTQNNPQNSTEQTDINTYNPTYGVTPEQWTQMNDTQRATIVAIDTVKKQAYQTDGQQLTFADALKNAAQDPTIVAKFADAAKLDAQTFAQNLAQIQQASTSTAEQQQMQFENDRKQLAETAAAKGQAYSGFRGQAQEQLGKTESGIVQSSRALLKQQLDSATKEFESKYGTGATKAASANFADPFANSNISLSGQYVPATQTSTTLTGDLAGGITGTQAGAQSDAVNKKAVDLYNVANVVPTLN